MARGATVGALRIELSADMAEFEEDMRKVGATMSKVGNIMKAAMAGLGVTMAGVAAGIAAAVGTTVREIDRMGRAADGIGITVQQLSALRHAAEQVGVQFDTLNSGLTTFTQKIFEAAENSKSAAARAFQMLGVAVKDAQGRLKDTETILLEVADAFARLPQGVEKATLATRLFGSAGGELIRVLDEGSIGIRNLMQEAEQLGIVVDERTTEAAERLNRVLDRSSVSLSNLASRITIAVLPALEMLADALERVAGTARPMAPTLAELEGQLERLKIQALEWQHVINDPSAHAEQVATAERQLELIRQRIALIEFEIERHKQLQDIASRGWETTVHPMVQMVEQAGETMRKTGEKVRESWASVADGMSGVKFAFERAFVDIVTGARKVEDVLKNLLKRLADIFLSQAFNALVGGLFAGPAGAFAGLGGIFAGSFAQGGSFEVGGPGGIDSKLVAFRATPGERVTISKKGEEDGGLAILQPRVVVNNYADASVDPRTREDGTLELTVRAIVRDEMGSERMNPIMRNKHGLQPRLRAR